MPDASDPIAAIAEAEAIASAEHKAGTCHLSEWSCSSCEDAEALGAEACIAPPGNLCTDTGCWDADRCIIAARPSARESAWIAFRDGPDYTPTDRYPVRDAFNAGWSLSLASASSEGWAVYAAEQERHAETTARLERLRDGVAYLHDVYAVAPNKPRCCSDCAANDISGEIRRLFRDA